MNDKLKKLCSDFFDLTPILPGSISEQYNVCGKANCRCKDKTNPQKHGPQKKLSFTLSGKNSTMVIKKADVKIASLMNDNYARLRQLQSGINAEIIRIYKEEGAEVAQIRMKAAISHARSKITGVKVDAKKVEKLEASREQWKKKAADRSVKISRNTTKINGLSTSRDKWKTAAVSLKEESQRQRIELDELKQVCKVQTEELVQLKEELKKRGNGENSSSDAALL